MSEQISFWNDVMTASQSDSVLHAAMYHAASGLSDMVGRSIDIDILHVETVPISQVMTYAGSPEAEMVGVYLLIGGDLPGQAILMLTLDDALRLVDLLIGVPPGTTTGLGDLERSALAEVGNLTVSFFLNEMATLTGMPLRPSPPAVMVDMLGAILDVVATSVAAVSDDLRIVETVFKDAGRIVQVRFWLLPDPTILILDGSEHQMMAEASCG